MHQHPWLRSVVFLGLVVSGCGDCGRNTGTNTSSSSSTGGGSSGQGGSSGTGSLGSSSGGAGSTSANASTGGTSQPASSGGFNPVGPIPLDQLCPYMARGYTRMFYFYGTGFTSADCSPAFDSEEDALSNTFGHVDEVYRDLCSPDGGAMFSLVAAISEAQRSGRIRYVPEEAAACVNGGRRFFGSLGGLHRARTPYDGGAVLLDGGGDFDAAIPDPYFFCPRVFVGLQGQGQPCRYNPECATSDGGPQMVCFGRAGANCEGTCRTAPVAGEACGRPVAPDCASGFTCLGVGDGGKQCTRNAVENETCGADAGAPQCEGQFTCVNGTCARVTPPQLGERCDPNSSTCAQDLYCARLADGGGACEALHAEGEGCEVNFLSSNCRACLDCVSNGADPDAGRTCRAYVGPGGDCSVSPCHTGLRCVGGTCVPLPRTGQACDPADGGNLRTCFYFDERCAGTPSTCVAAGRVGQPCQGSPGSLPTNGSCQGSLVCSRPTAQATNGTCVDEPTVGQPCGYVQDLVPTCQSPYQCSTYEDGGRGQCLERPARQGGACNYTGDCGRGLECVRPDDAGSNTLGSCQPSPVMLGENCGTHSRCQGGWCQYQGVDGNFETRCVPSRAAGDVCGYNSDECAAGSSCSYDNGTARCSAPANTCEDGSDFVQSCMDGGVSMILWFGVMVGALNPWWRRRRKAASEHRDG